VWIELHQAVWTHRKTFELAGYLDLDETYAAAHVIRLWTWALDNAPDGDLSSLSDRAIAYGAGWRDDAARFVSALVATCWLDDGKLIHDWDDYAGRLLEQRSHQSRMKVRARALANTPALVIAVRARDQDRCRYCRREVNWKDRRGPNGGTYDHVDPAGENTLENVVVACRACNAGKGQRTPEQSGYRLRAVPTELSADQPADTDRKNPATGPNRTGQNHTEPRIPPNPPQAGGPPLARRNTHSRSRANGPDEGAEPTGSLTPEEIAAWMAGPQ
jgi:hypothetical protein